jgi:hypothetical protein
MTVVPPTSRYGDKRARAELLGNVGAGALGAGLGLLFGEVLAKLAVPLLVVGGVVHALAMYQKHHLDTSKGTVGPGWTEWAYWTCWLLLLALAGYVWWSRVQT